MIIFVRAWIFLSALLVGAGWILSGIHELNRTGYLVFFLLVVIALFFFCWRNLRSHLRNVRNQFWQGWRKLSCRFCRPAPFLFLGLLLLALIGGVLYPPTNIDTEAYRIPRVLHWLGQEQWHWIHTYDPRMNSTGCGFEWLSAPLILFTRTDRLVFLINWISYLMLPGMIFSVFTRLEIQPRVAWWWMWFLSSGWCFVMQAGSTGNDSFTAIYALAALDLALRAKETRSVRDFWLSMLAAALAGGAKQINLPLLLPWVIAAGSSLRLLSTRPMTTVIVGLASLLISALPITIANLVFTGNWMGFSRYVSGMENPLWINAKFDGSPFWGIVGNTFNITIQNLVPPYFPIAERWNAWMEHFTHTSFGMHFTSFDHFGSLFRFVTETTVGVGTGVCLLVLPAVLAACRSYRANAGSFFFWLRLSPWLALLVLMAKTGSFSAGRYLAPYYPFLLPLILVRPEQHYLVRKKWWQMLGLLVMLFTALLLMMSFDRPLFPVRTMIGWLQTHKPNSGIVLRLEKLYGIHSLSYIDERNPFEKDLAQERLIGCTSDGGLLEPGLWLPFGCRKVELVRAEDSPQQLRQRGIHIVVVEDLFLQMTGKTIEQWMKQFDAELINEAIFQQQPTYRISHVYIARLRLE